MSEPTTRPGEYSRIAQNEYEFRIEVLTGQARMEAMLQAHMEDDRRQFAEIKTNLRGVTSLVNEAKKESSDGIRNAILSLGKSLAVLGGWAIAVWLAFKGGKP